MWNVDIVEVMINKTIRIQKSIPREVVTRGVTFKKIVGKILMKYEKENS